MLTFKDGKLQATKFLLNLKLHSHQFRKLQQKLTQL